jgi:hypothetical protein
VFAWFFTFFFLAPIIIINFKGKAKNMAEIKLPINYKKYIQKLIDHQNKVYLSFLVFIVSSFFCILFSSRAA